MDIDVFDLPLFFYALQDAFVLFKKKLIDVWGMPFVLALVEILSLNEMIEKLLGF